IPLLAAGSPYAKLFDEVWALSADEKIRVKRAAERDGISESDVALRMKNQPSDAEREEIADTVIRSDLGSAEFERQIYDGLKKSIGRRIK
ncbi:MAG: dephospho-CoA kinase, partial [Christensenellales bacterium]